MASLGNSNIICISKDLVFAWKFKNILTILNVTKKVLIKVFTHTLSYQHHENPPTEDIFLDFFKKKMAVGKSAKLMVETYR